MKCRITFKDPDSLNDQLEDEERRLTKYLQADKRLSAAGASAEAAERMQPIRKLASKYFEYSEYVTIELDSDAQTATVVTNRNC